jgi:HSP20 family protein
MLPTMRQVSAFDTLLDLGREMDRLVGQPRAERTNGHFAIMPAEVVESDEEIRFDIEIPGVRADDIEITLENGVLSITAEKKLERAENTKLEDYRLAERRYGKFQRTFAVPPTVRGDRCEARCDNGVLTVRLPKSEDARPRRIRVDTGAATRQIDTQSDVHTGSEADTQQA